MGLKFRRGSTAQQSGSLAFGEPYVNTTLGTLVVGGATGDIVLSAGGTGSTGNFGPISGSGLDITGNTNIGGNLTVGGQLTIGDQTSDTVNVVASLSSSLIPQTTNAFDLGSATKIWRDLYISTGSIKFVAGTTVVKELSLATIAGLESATGSSASTGSNIFIGAQTISGSLITNQKATFANQYGTAVEISGGVDINNDFNYPVNIKNNLVVSGSAILGANSAFSIEVSGSLKTNQTAYFANQYGTALEVTGAVMVSGNQTISGSLYVSQDLIIQGSSSIQNISSSTLVVGAAFVTLNTSTPYSNFAGISVVDSGSSFATASFVYDGLHNNWIFEKVNTGSSDTSVAIFGPISQGGLGTEVGLTENRLAKAVSAHGHHIGDSNISDDGTTISLATNTIVTGSVTAASFVGSISASNGVVSGSSQITYASISSIPSGIVSGSSQVTLSSTTGYGTVINQNLLTTSNVQHASLGIGMAASGTSGRIDAANDIVAYSSSDIRFKENITPIENALDKISKISGNTYDWKEENKIEHGYEGNDVGVIAQEIEAVLPQLVQTRDNGYKAVKYDKLVALLIQGMKEQQSQIEELKAKIGL